MEIRPVNAALPAPCPHCGGEVLYRLDPAGPALLRNCADCRDRDEELLSPHPAARRLLREVVFARRSLRERVRPPRPVVLIWLPPAGPDEDRYDGVAAMVRERLARDDPSVLLVSEPYPESGDEVAEAALADVSLLVAPSTADRAKAAALLGAALPPSRAHLVSFDPAAPESLFDEVADALARIRRVARWRSLSPDVRDGQPLSLYEFHAAAIGVANDDACAYLLRVAESAGTVEPVALVEMAGGGAGLLVRLDLLRSAGAVETTGDRVRVTAAGRALLDRIASPPGADRGRHRTALERTVAEARAGSQDALSRLLQKGGEHARRIARRRLGRGLRRMVDSIDISQSVMGDLMRGLDRFEFRGEAAWKGYLRRLVENKIRAKADYYGAAKRDLRRQTTLDSPAEDGPDLEPAAAAPDPSDALEREEEAERLTAALDRMPDAEREVILLRVFEGRSHREIAERLGRPSEAAVHKLYGRALARLADFLGRGRG